MEPQKLEFRPTCECQVCGKLLLLTWEEWFSLKAHYRKKRIMAPDCDNFPRGYWVIEDQKRYKVIGWQ